MTIATAYSRALSGMHAPLVRVEVHLANGLPAFNLVGHLETEVKESRERVRAAILNSGFEFPAKRITVNLAPADLPKESGRFDLPALPDVEMALVDNPRSPRGPVEALSRAIQKLPIKAKFVTRSEGL